MKTDTKWKNALAQNKPVFSRIYHAMGDETSRRLYESLLRLQYTGDVQYLIEAVQLNGFEPDPALLQYKMLQEWTAAQKPAILYGLGKIAESAFQLAADKEGAVGYLFFPFITDIPWAGYCDKNRRGTFGPEQKEIMTPEEMLAGFPDALICVAAEAFEEIKQELMELGFTEGRICRYIPGRTKFFEDKQYFGEAFMPPRQERFFVEGGAYRFDSAERFLDWNRGYGAEGLLCFEPDPVNYEICCQKLQEQTEGALARNSKIIHAGVSDRCAVMCFHAAGSDESQFSEARGGVSISLRPIDQEIGERNISFLKLDVEGFELAALQGAEQAIRRCRPRMAVCAYHKLEDLLKIPKWILDLEMGYTLQLRMYSNEYLEIVCYAY